MPTSAPRPCSNHPCRKLVRGGGRCPECRAKYEKQRGTSNDHGYTWKWRVARKKFLEQNPMCAQPGCIERATVVDHRVPHRGDPELFWNEGNWQSLCARHHNSKTARHDGGFGRYPVKH